jgi:O-succinylbenzoate synthase
MKITKVELLRLGLPMLHPFTTSFGEVKDKQTVIVKLYSGDLVGYGEAASFNAPLFNEETVDTCLYMLETFIAPAILNKEFKTVEEFVASYSYLKGHYIAKAGAEFAFWHLLAQEQGKSLAEMFGATNSEILVGESLGIKPSIAETLEEVDLRLEEGYRRIKLKIKPKWDLKLVEAVRAKHPDIELMVDGNSAYNLKDHLQDLLALDNFNLLMIEQPLGDDDIIDHSTLQRLMRTPICLDESIKTPGDARKAISTGACRIINIKPVRVGGGLAAMQIHDIAAEHKIPVWNGGMLETGIGRAFNIALAAKPNYTLPADMSPYQLFYEEDIVVKSFEVVDGKVQVPTEPGLGFEVDQKKVEKYTLSKKTIK